MLPKSTRGYFQASRSQHEEKQALTNPLSQGIRTSTRGDALPHVTSPTLLSLGKGEPPTFTIHFAADKFKAQRAGTAAHHRVDADELGSDGRVEHVGLHGAIVHVPLENLQRGAGLSAPALPQPRA